MYEGFSGCRVLAYCLMDNHIHLLLEVPPMPAGGLTDEELLRRLKCLYSKENVAIIAGEIAAARAKNLPALAEQIHARYTYRMHDLSFYMKSLMGRFAQWYNREHERKGVFWEERFKSVIVEDGYASRTMAAYIDLNPLRAGMVKDPAQYAWSSYGEAMAGKNKARAGLVRAYMAHKGWPASAKPWHQGIAQDYRRLLLLGSQRRGAEEKNSKPLKQKIATRERAELAHDAMIDQRLSEAIQSRVRYFADGAVLGSRGYVNTLFEQSRQRFGPRRHSGARKLRGPAAPAAALLWSIRDLRKDLGTSS